MMGASVKKLAVASLAALVMLAGCGATTAGTLPGKNAPPGGDQPPAHVAQPWSPAGEDFSDELPPLRTTQNEVRLLVDGPEIFPAMERIIAGAQRQVEVDYFVFSGRQGMRLAHLLAARARSGVHVDVVFDPGKGFTPAFKRAADTVIATMTEAGVHVTGFPLERLPRRMAVNKVVDHDKVVVADRLFALVGGMNIADVFERNHDFMLEVRGPAAADVGRMIASDRRHSLPLVAAARARAPAPGAIVPPEDRAPGFDGQQVPVRIASTGINRRGYKEILLDQIRRSARSIHALMFQLVDDEVIAALVEARQRGVDVRVILDPGVHDELIPVIKKAPRGFPNLPVALQLQKAGVGVRWYRLSADQIEMHAKVGVFDGRTMLLGSTNWIPSAFFYNNEMSLMVEGGAAVRRMEAVFEADWRGQSDAVVDKGVGQDVLSWIIEHIPYL